MLFFKSNHRLVSEHRAVTVHRSFSSTLRGVLAPTYGRLAARSLKSERVPACSDTTLVDQHVLRYSRLWSNFFGTLPEKWWLEWDEGREWMRRKPRSAVVWSISFKGHFIVRLWMLAFTTETIQLGRLFTRMNLLATTEAMRTRKEPKVG